MYNWWRKFDWELLHFSNGIMSRQDFNGSKVVVADVPHQMAGTGHRPPPPDNRLVYTDFTCFCGQQRWGRIFVPDVQDVIVFHCDVCCVPVVRAQGFASGNWGMWI